MRRKSKQEREDEEEFAEDDCEEEDSKGGSSQDKYESDFVNDGKMDFDELKEEKKVEPKKLVKNQHFSEEEYHTKSQNTEGSED